MPLFFIMLKPKRLKNGGIKCIGITTTHKRSELEEADKIIDSFNELTVDKIL